ncbi:MAG: hypothetical protein WA344_00940, partial [Ralstonia pickettii]
WGCKPEPPKFPSPQFQPRHERIEVDDLAVALEGVMPVQQDVPPGRRRYLGDEPRWAGLRFRRELPLWLTEISAVPAYNP